MGTTCLAECCGCNFYSAGTHAELSLLRSSARSGWAVMPGMSLKSRGGSRDFQQVKQQCMVNVSVTVIIVLGFSSDGNSFLYWRFVMTWSGMKNYSYCSLCSASTVISRVCAMSGLHLAVERWEMGLWSSAVWYPLGVCSWHTCITVFTPEQIGFSLAFQ